MLYVTTHTLLIKPSNDSEFSKQTIDLTYKSMIVPTYAPIISEKCVGALYSVSISWIYFLTTRL